MVASLGKRRNRLLELVHLVVGFGPPRLVGTGKMGENARPVNFT